MIHTTPVEQENTLVKKTTPRLDKDRRSTTATLGNLVNALAVNGHCEATA